MNHFRIFMPLRSTSKACLMVEELLFTKKAKQSRYTPWWHLGEGRYSFYSFFTSAVDGVSSQRHAPAALCPWERTPGTHCTWCWVGLRAGLDTGVRGKILWPCRRSNPDRPVVKSVVRHYTDWATPAPELLYIYIFICGLFNDATRNLEYRAE
jgi:hypothetical protein